MLRRKERIVRRLLVETLRRQTNDLGNAPNGYVHETLHCSVWSRDYDFRRVEARPIGAGNDQMGGVGESIPECSYYLAPADRQRCMVELNDHPNPPVVSRQPASGRIQKPFHGRMRIVRHDVSLPRSMSRTTVSMVDRPYQQSSKRTTGATPQRKAQGVSSRVHPPSLVVSPASIASDAFTPSNSCAPPLTPHETPVHTCKTRAPGSAIRSSV